MDTAAEHHEDNWITRLESKIDKYQERMETRFADSMQILQELGYQTRDNTRRLDAIDARHQAQEEAARQAAQRPWHGRP